VDFFNQDRRVRRTNNRRRRVLSASQQLLQGEQRVLGASQHGAERVGRGFDVGDGGGLLDGVGVPLRNVAPTDK
jgi:hypothetical protein